MENNKRIFSEVIKRQIAILGPDITLAKVKNVPGIEVNSTGEVVNLQGDPQVLLQELINQFVELSGLIVKKTMESILATHPDGVSFIGNQIFEPSEAENQTTVQKTPNPVQAPPGYNIDQQGSSAPPPQENSMMQKDTDSNIASANRDIEDLNKILNNLNTGNSK